MGLTYDGVLDLMHQTLLPRTYLEIGVQNGYSLALTLPCTEAIGVDPAPNVLAAQAPNTIIERSESDTFFESGRAAELLESRPVDIAFIDGMHLFEFALRDFCNIERFCHDNSIVVIDDCLPRNRQEAQRERESVGWTGDVWKVIECLRVERPDLDITILRAPPTGLAIVRGLDPERAVDGRDQALIDRYMTLDFSDLHGQVLPATRTLDATPAMVDSLLQQRPFQACDDVSDLIAGRDSRRPDIGVRLRRFKQRVKHSPIGAVLRRGRQAVRQAKRRFLRPH